MRACWSAFIIYSSETVPPKLSAIWWSAPTHCPLSQNAVSWGCRSFCASETLELPAESCPALFFAVDGGGTGKTTTRLDRTETFSIGFSCSVSYLNFGPELIFFVISAMVVSVRDNFGATPWNLCRITCLDVFLVMEIPIGCRADHLLLVMVEKVSDADIDGNVTCRRVSFLACLDLFGWCWCNQDFSWCFLILPHVCLYTTCFWLPLVCVQGAYSSLFCWSVCFEWIPSLL